MIMRWLACGAGNVHLLSSCPKCYATQGGLLVGTISSTHKGRVTALCLDCGYAVDYYVDAQEEKIWKLESIEAKGPRAVDTSIKAKGSRVVDTPIKIGEPVLR